MKYLKKFNEEYLNKEVSDYLEDIGIALKDIGVNIVFQKQGDKLLMYLAGGLGFKFTLADIRDEVNHIINFMEDSGHILLSAKYKYVHRLIVKGYLNIWKVMYEVDNLNRWGIPQQKEDIFDIQDLDLSKQKIESFELKFGNF
jgi:hypothetical protein